jgi:UDP-glucose 4-epimerase
MAVFVTGGAGYIGSHVVLALQDSGEQVIVLDNLSTGFKRAVPPGVIFFEGDVADVNLLNIIFDKYRPNAVLHFAGSVVVPESVSDPLFYYNNNTVKSHVLIGESIKAGIEHFIFSSTAAVYGTPRDFELVSESSSVSPQSPYGSSKLMTETMLKDASLAHAFRYIALRYFNVAGADPLGRVGQATLGATHLLKVACEVAAGKRNSISVYGNDYPTKDGTCVRDFIHVSDLASAHVLALQELRADGVSGVMNCGYGVGFSVLEVLDTVARLAEKNIAWEFVDRRPGDAVSVVADVELIRKRLGWVPKYNDLDLIVSTALKWEKTLT